MLAAVVADPRCAWRSTVDRHFQRRIRPAEESGLRAHLPHCPPCRQRYDRHLLLAELSPRRNPDAADRLATGLGLTAVADVPGERWPLSDWRWVMAGMALGAGVVMLALTSADRGAGGGPGAQGWMAAAGAREAPAIPRQEPPLAIFRHAPEGLVELTGDAVAADDRLVFAVRNDRWRYLTIAALDEGGALHLLSPTRAIARAPGLQLLPERPLPAVRGIRLRVVALLTDRPPADADLGRVLGETLPPAAGLRVETAVCDRAGDGGTVTRPTASGGDGGAGRC